MPEENQKDPILADNAWRDGRQFTVHDRVITDGLTFSPGYIYATASFGRVNVNGRCNTLSPAGKMELMSVIQWLDSVNALTSGLSALIRHHPESPLVRGFLRSEIGIAPPKDKTPKTTKGWIEFIESERPKRTTPGPMPVDYSRIADNILAGNIVLPENTIMVNIRAKKEESGRCSYWETTHYRGRLNIPMNVFRGGYYAIMDWIYDNEHAIADSFEAISDGEERDDYEATDSDFTVGENNINAVIHQYNERNGTHIPDSSVPLETIATTATVTGATPDNMPDTAFTVTATGATPDDIET